MTPDAYDLSDEEIESLRPTIESTLRTMVPSWKWKRVEAGDFVLYVQANAYELRDGHGWRILGNAYAHRRTYANAA